jgi:hypothetical protein
MQETRQIFYRSSVSNGTYILIEVYLRIESLSTLSSDYEDQA